MEQNITVKGARVHNLKNVSVSLPRDKLVVFTGLSGSGKSSLAFDTIYAEGQRRYMESLSSYARQFLGIMDKPDVDSISGLSPAISIDQKTTSKNPRSTVGTVTEIYDYLRLLYARIGVPHCPVCGKEIKQQTVDQIVDKIMTLPEKTKFQVLAPIARGKKGEYRKEFESAAKQGFARVRVDGILYDLSEEIKLNKNVKHNIEIVVDRLVMKEGLGSRLADSLETAFSLTDGTVLIDVVDGETLLFSQNFACPEHGSFYDELEPRMFSFNNPFGACPTCSGLGVFMRVSEDLVVPNRNLSLRQGAIVASGWSNADKSTIAAMYYEALAKRYGFTMDTPFAKISAEGQHALLYGTEGERIKMVRTNEYGSGTYMTEFEGVIRNLERRYRESSSDWAHAEIEQYMTESPCPDCHGARLKPASLAVTVGGKNITELTEMSVSKELAFIEALELTEKEELIGKQILKEIKARLRFLCDVGLDYLTLARAAGTLSGGESQRIRLATQIGSSLMGVLYILDEPSIGLHQRDNRKLLDSLCRLRDLGNTLIVVEHDNETIATADYIVDVGPGAGIHGGEIICAGTPAEIAKCKKSITGQYLSGKKQVEVPETRRKGSGKFLTVKGARENNLKNIDVKIPLGELVLVTGVSGSGKSSLINEILYKKLAAELNNAKKFPGKHDAVLGIENLDKVINIDQSPIGRTPRSNIATYTGVFNDIRNLFAQTAEAKARGYDAGRFSFNVKGGRCEACEGDGILKIEMNFLSDVYVPCEVCHGARYNRETLEVHYKGKTISDVLNMTVEEAVGFFENIPKIRRKLEVIFDVGLGYVTLGQSATTLSGGEAQRVKLATELSKIATGKTIYILDEPTTGLHTDDVRRLIAVINKLVEKKNSVIIIEHNLDVIKCADWIIDLGPEGGDGGGTLVCSGTPEQVAKCAKSYTGQYLKPLLKKK